jgi:hypothetical protein
LFACKFLKRIYHDSIWLFGICPEPPSRTARKDFYDLYFICQKISLRQLFDPAPQKYSNVRDFEVQIVKRLVYFENAKADVDPFLLKHVSWHAVKDYFIQQAKEISSNWM